MKNVLLIILLLTYSSITHAAILDEFECEIEYSSSYGEGVTSKVILQPKSFREIALWQTPNPLPVNMEITEGSFEAPLTVNNGDLGVIISLNYAHAVQDDFQGNPIKAYQNVCYSMNFSCNDAPDCSISSCGLKTDPSLWLEVSLSPSGNAIFDPRTIAGEFFIASLLGTFTGKCNIKRTRIINN